MTTPAPPTTTVTLTLSRKASRSVLEALQMLEEKWQQINRTSTDKDEQAEYGRDALDVHSTRESIKSQEGEAFGPRSLMFRATPFPHQPQRTANHSRDHRVNQ